MKGVYLVVHPLKCHDAALMRSIVSTFEKAGFQVCSDSYASRLTSCTETPTAYGCEYVVAVGGDGTLLGANQLAVENGLPLLGVNLGRVGFLTEVEPEQLSVAAKRLYSGEYAIEKRMMLKAMYGDGESALALNDVVISRGDYTRLIAVGARIGDDLIGRYIADGVIVSSPTGSTGYSLSAGGPIVSPKVDCMVLCPICAHSLQHRPAVISGEDTITLELENQQQDLMLSIDGRVSAPLKPDATIKICKAEQRAMFIRFEDKGFFSLVRQKLSEWSC